MLSPWAAIYSEIADLEERIQGLEHLRLADLLRESPESMEPYISKLQISARSNSDQDKNISLEQHKNTLQDLDNGTSDVASVRLFRFLILSGYLNEDYALYIAIFRERDGWSANDRLFNTILKSRDVAKPDLVIDHPKDVCARLNKSDFSSKYVLNVSLFDYLLNWPDLEKKRILLVLKYLEKSFDSNETQGFLSIYYKQGKRLRELCNALLEDWPNYLDTVIEGSSPEQHIAIVLDKSDHYLIEHHLGRDELRLYLEDNLESVYINGSISTPGTYSYNLLSKLNVKVTDFASISENSHLLRFLHSHLLFKINMSNIHAVIGLNSKDTSQIHLQTYCLLSECDEKVTSYVNENLDEYLEKVMLCNEQNREEPEWVINMIINDQSLSPDLIKKVISHQNHIFRSIDDVREVFWQYILEEDKVVPTWGTAFRCYMSEQVDNGLVVAFMNQEESSQTLRNDTFSVKGKDEDILSFKRFILNLDEVPDNIYERLNLGIDTKWTGFPKVSDNKKLLLIVSNIVSFNSGSYDTTEDNPQLRVALIKQHYSEFQKEIDTYAATIQHDVALELFQDQELPESFKVELSGILDVETLATSAELSNLVSPYYLKVDDSRLEIDVMQRLIAVVKDQEVAIGLFKRFIENWTEDEAIDLLIKVLKRWSKKTVMAAIRLFPSAINTIANYGKQPLIQYSDVNHRLVEALREADCVGKVKIEGNEIRVYTKKVRPI